MPPWDRASRRRNELPHDWHIIRRDILERDASRCQIRGPHCTTHATDVDHIGDRNNHSRTNLRAACQPCHAERTATQGHEAARAARAAGQHPIEKHPSHT